MGSLGSVVVLSNILIFIHDFFGIHISFHTWPLNLSKEGSSSDLGASYSPLEMDCLCLLFLL